MIFPSDDDARFARDRLADGCRTMEGLLRGLLEPDGSVAREVHAIRKLGKTLRGGFALFRLEKTSAREIQAIGRLLSGPRDAVSRLSTWQKLKWNEDPATADAIASLLDQQTNSAALPPPRASVEWCLARLKTAQDQLETLESDHPVERLAKGVKKLRKRLVRRCRDLDHHGEEDFHDARKALKAYLGAIGFLPEEIITADPTMDDLAEILGDENDLATLSSWLEEHGFTHLFAASLWKLLARKRRQLRKRAIRDAEQLGTLPPPAETASAGEA